MGLSRTVTEIETARHDLRLAWVTVALLPIFLVLAFLVGEGLAVALGYDESSDTAASWYVALPVGVAAFLVLACPAVATWHFGRRAMRHGQPKGLFPMVVAVTVVAAFAVVNVASYLLILVAG